MTGKCRFRFVRFLLAFAVCLSLPALLGAGEKKEPGDNPGASPAAGKPADPPETFEEKVNAAIKKGVDYLLSRQKDDGSFPLPSRGKASTYPLGYSALATLALLKCGESSSSKPIIKAFDYLSRQPYKYTYSVALYLMALEARYYNPKKFKKHVDKRMKGYRTSAEEASASFKPKVHPADRKLAQELADWLISVQLSYGPWTYGKAKMSAPDKREPVNSESWYWDNSNTQFALLGLKAASRLGARIPANVYVKSLVHFLEMQQKDGPKVPAFPIPAAHLDSFEYEAKKKKKKKKKGKYSTSSDHDEMYGSERDEYTARGWHYCYKNGKYLYLGPTMTAGGLACVIICKSELLKHKVFKKLKKKTNESIEDSCAYLFIHFNDNGPRGWDRYEHYFFYWYGTERMGALSGLRKFSGYDWYREGAKKILGMQKPDGHWEYDHVGVSGIGNKKFYPRDEVNTSFALLFLKRATVGVIEGDLIYTGKGLLDKKAKKEKQEKENHEK